MWITLTTISWVLATGLTEGKLLYVNEPNFTIIMRMENLLDDTTRLPLTTCPSRFEQLKDNCYFISEGKANWHSAEISCRKKGSILAEPLNDAVDRSLRVHILSPQFDQVERWIGAKYDPAKSAWIWGRTGEVIPYHSFWRRKFKKNLDWHCAAMNPKKSNAWIPRLCHKRRKYICHTPARNVTSNLSTPRTTNPLPRPGDIDTNKIPQANST